MGESTAVRQAILLEVKTIVDKFNLTQVDARAPVRMMVQGADSIDHVSSVLFYYNILSDVLLHFV